VSTSLLSRHSLALVLPHLIQLTLQLFLPCILNGFCFSRLWGDFWCIVFVLLINTRNTPSWQRHEFRNSFLVNSACIWQFYKETSALSTAGFCPSPLLIFLSSSSPMAPPLLSLVSGLPGYFSLSLTFVRSPFSSLPGNSSPAHAPDWIAVNFVSFFFLPSLVFFLTFSLSRLSVCGVPRAFLLLSHSSFWPHLPSEICTACKLAINCSFSFFSL
jgi:hypothetical protein